MVQERKSDFDVGAPLPSSVPGPRPSALPTTSALHQRRLAAAAAVAKGVVANDPDSTLKLHTGEVYAVRPAADSALLKHGRVRVDSRAPVAGSYARWRGGGAVICGCVVYKYVGYGRAFVA